MDREKPAPHVQPDKPDKPDKYWRPKVMLAIAGILFLLGAIWSADSRWQLLGTGAILLGAWAVWLRLDT